MIEAADVVGWLTANGITGPETLVTDLEELPAMPDRVCAVALVGGAPTLRERTFDQPQVQIMCRGRQSSVTDAENFAAQIDNVLMAATFPFLMGGVRVASLDRLGGPPARVDTDQGRRTIMATSYMLQIARDVF